MTRFLLALILAVATLAAVLLFHVLTENTCTDYPEGNIHD